ncbi:MAG TPA: hypothetical protein PLV45_15540 [bacterium]|nr:hypothetical protein [bacterium]
MNIVRFILLFACIAGTVQGQCLLTFNVEETVTAAEGSAAQGSITEEGIRETPADQTPETRTYPLEVTLGDQFIEAETPESITVWDFAGKRRIILDKKDKTGISDSLFSDIGFRVYEFQNRLMLGDIMASAGIESNPMDPVLSEHMFSLSSGKDADLKRVVEGKCTTFTHDDKDLFRWCKGDAAISEMNRVRLIMFLRYQFGIHPDILEEFKDLKSFPETMTVYRYNVKTQSETLTMVSVGTRDHRTPLAAYDFGSTDDGEIPALARRLRKSTGKEYAEACSSMVTRAAAFAETNKYLDSAALFLANILATGKEFPPEFFKYRDSLSRDPDVQMLFASISPQDETAAKKAVADLKTLSEKTAGGQCAIHVFRGNILASLGESTAAIESFTRALKQEPMILGAWKDLGSVYYDSYETPAAWLCWDAARSVNADHPLLKTIDDLETKLMTEHPEFFLSVSGNAGDDATSSILIAPVEDNNVSENDGSGLAAR